MLQIYLPMCKPYTDESRATVKIQAGSKGRPPSARARHLWYYGDDIIAAKNWENEFVWQHIVASKLIKKKRGAW